MHAKQPIDDVRIQAIKELSPPSHLLREFPLDERPAELVVATRQAIHRILHGMDDRLLVVVGPCSIHDPKAAANSAATVGVIVFPTMPRAPETESMKGASDMGG